MLLYNELFRSRSVLARCYWSSTKFAARYHARSRSRYAKPSMKASSNPRRWYARRNSLFELVLVWEVLLGHIDSLSTYGVLFDPVSQKPNTQLKPKYIQEYPWTFNDNQIRFMTWFKIFNSPAQTNTSVVVSSGPSSSSILTVACPASSNQYEPHHCSRNDFNTSSQVDIHAGHADFVVSVLGLLS